MVQPITIAQLYFVNICAKMPIKIPTNRELYLLTWLSFIRQNFLGLHEQILDSSCVL